jgi:hypothetical protein
MGNLFGDLGFEASNRKEFERLVRRAARSGSQAGRSGKFHYVLWTPGEGIELWVQMTAQETIIGCNPFFSGVGRIRMGVMQIAENPEHPIDGYLQGWANPEPQQTDAGLYPFAVDVPDFHLVKDKVLVSAVIHLQISAFAEYLHCYQDDDEFHRRPLSDEEARLSPEAFIPVGVLGENGSNPQSQASFSGHVQSAEVRVNPITGRKFHVLAVQTLGGVFDVLADPALVTGLPLAGGVIFGAFRLSARLLRVGY